MWAFGKGLFQVYSWGTDAAEAGDLAEVYYKFISGGQMQRRLDIWQRFIPSLLVRDKGAEAGDLEEVYSKFISVAQKQLRLGIWKRFIPSLFVGDRSSLS